jgi:hypothetical protein
MTSSPLLRSKIPAAILVGGTAAAVHAVHRIYFDHDHVVKDLAKNYDAAILALESIAGWHIHRRAKGKMVLGNVNKIAAGLRNQRRSAPLETTEVVLGDGRRLRLPTMIDTRTSTTSDAGLCGERRPNAHAECWQNLRFEPWIATHPSGTAPTRMRQWKTARS